MKKLFVCLLALALLILPGLTVEAGAAEIIDSGSCGDNVTWVLDSEGALTISGTGPMWIFEIGSYPWSTYFNTVTSLVIEKGVTSISDYAFCGFLFYNIEIPDGVTRIGTSAFSQCYYVEDLYIPASVTTIGIEAFRDCGNQGIWVDVDNPNYSSDQYGVLFNKNKTTLIQATYRLSGSYQIPSTVATIADRAFMHCSNLTSIEIPQGVTTIGVDTFYGCYDLTSIHIPKSVTRIDGAFSNCNSLTDVYYGGTEAQWDAIYIHESYGNEALLNANIHYTTPAASGNPFVDVATKDYYFEPVQWAVKNGITNGMDATHFAPDGTCTRAQIVTFLWRANGSPKPSSSKNPFRDIPAGQWYTDAVLWAVEKGITTGTSATTFSPDAGCTRGQVATFLWRSRGQTIVIEGSGFYDVDAGDYYYNAVLWAVMNGITNGMGDGRFAPNALCTRGQVVTFLYRNNQIPDDMIFYSLEVDVINNNGAGYNEDGRVNWQLMITARYNGSYYESGFNCNIVTDNIWNLDFVIRDLDFVSAWSNAKNGISARWWYAGSDSGYGNYRAGGAYILPDDPSFAGRYTASITFGDVTKTATFTLVYNGNYETGTGWSVTDIVWA